MAKNNFTFQTAIKLNSAGFKKGIKDVQKSINSLKSSFISLAGALGMGLSFGKIISEAKKTATELSVAMAVLENASRVTNKAGEVLDNYATNLEFVRGIAKKYKQDLVGLINTFGQFTAAANQVKDANGNIAITLEDQKYIYEQLTRAAAGYHMSADRANDMMNAIVQMMSKGKVAAEELRRQLGNALPGAFGIMAAAMGVSNAELEDMMKKGQVLAADALPRFAKMLEGITEHMSFDSLQSSTNEMKNAWVELINEMKVSSVLKDLTDALTKLINYTRKNLNDIWAWIKGTLLGTAIFKLLNGLYNTVHSNNAKWLAELQAIEKANKRITSESQKYITSSYVKKRTTIGGAEYNVFDPSAYKKNITTKVRNDPRAAIELENIKKYNDNLLQMNKLQKQLGQKGFLTKEDISKIKAANSEISKFIPTLKNSQEQVNICGRMLGGLKNIASQIWSGLVSIGVWTAVFAAIGAIVGLLEKWWATQKHIKEEQERINNIIPNYEKSIENIQKGTTTTANNLKQLVQSLKGMDTNSAEYASKIQEINKQLGLTGEAAFTVKTAYEDINKEVDRWIDKQRSLAVINKALSSQDEAEARNMQLQNQLDEAFNDFYNKFKIGGRQYIDLQSGNLKDNWKEDLSGRQSNWLKKNIQPILQEMKANRSVIEKAISTIDAERKKLAEKYGVDVSGDSFTGNTTTVSGGTSTKVSTPTSVMDDYLKKRKELDNQFKNGALTEEEFKDKIVDLEEETYKAIAAFDEWDKVMAKLSKTSREEAEKLKEAYPSNQQAKKDKSAKEEAEKKAKAEAEATKKAIEAQLKALDEMKVPKQKKRDTSFDYSKEPLDIRKEIADLKTEQAEAIQDIIDALKEGIVKGDFDLVKQDAINKLFELVGALKQVKDEATDLQRKVKLSEAIDSLNKKIKEMEESTFSNLTSLAESFDRVNNSLMGIAQVFDEDLKESELFKSYEAFSTVLNHSIQIMEAVGSVIQTLQTIQDIAAKKKVKDAAMEVAANKAAAASELEKATASASAAVAGGASSVASIPIVGPALAVAAAAAIVAAILAGMSKFATGGIIGGDSYSGDKQVARVNSGEMILNRQQQRTLLDIANGKTKGSGGQVDFKIRGADLVGVINNYYSRMKG